VNPHRLISMKQLAPEKGVDFSRAHIYRLIKEKRFPAPIRIGSNRIAFVEREIDQFIEARINERDGAA
jgi:prophage regulatory protein